MAKVDQRGEALVRMLQIIHATFGASRVTQEDLAVICDCSVRTIRRDIATMQQAGVPITCSRVTGCHLTGEWEPLKLTLTLQEVFALLLAREAVAGRPGLPFTHSTQTVFDKITHLLPQEMRKQFDSAPVAYASEGTRDYSKAPWGQLMASIQRREQLEMHYYTISRDSYSQRLIDPYHIIWLGDSCQLVAYCYKQQKVINFAMDGIMELRQTGETFKVQKGFSLASHIASAAGPMLGDPVDIQIRFDAAVARYAKRRRWSFPHTLTECPNGDLILSATVRGLNDIRKEVLTWGRFAEVLEPPALREQMLEHCRAMLAYYESSSITPT